MSSETPYLVVMIAAGSAHEARTLARTAVAEKLAACAQVFPIQSYYEWHDAIAEDNEYLVLLKSHRDAYATLEARMLALHSYEVPEIIAVPVVAGLPAYTDWLTAVVGGRASNAGQQPPGGDQ